ncbi:protein phosphatase 1 regulatory subunit 16A-like isoform X1 [Mizuhopecten yessoensis]|uniref:protein phosphatase 1 regulatory subunit 16A-like isoform X1 n=1 Tax=Mizuhopecten yessoensis TaxID=6573 RepID=UPI000B45C30A|nr:protein phosphatase 1 regulatory subunit 16A-like isoform X1 [Mizuhopecten yessoensis]XP_021379338.1 protein phosphatase 1 regulatory subunit 16A-like isoform X1 [Mizuhopecten yessoensis]XP_021379339.1 protein phosphatase 1 regulatory subunit 16A-like isoform X1 [Mizuhopecten yessoensis]
MTDHQDLISEIASVEKMPTQDRLKHAKKRRSQQLKKWANYEKQIEKDSKRKKSKSQQRRSGNRARVRFPGKIVLLEAAARNDIDDVRRLLTQGVNPNSTNEDGLTALHQCCIDDSEEMLKLLLEFGALVNAQDSEMWTPLHAAATCGHVHLCKHLIDKGAELLAVNADGNMPYDICEDEVTLDYIETEMAKRGVTQEEIDDTRLVAEKEMLKDMEYIVSQNGNLEYYTENGTTPLHIAAANGFMQVAEFLLDHHVSVDMRDRDSWLPIHAAACWLQPEMIELLVRNGADIDSKAKNGETPFDLCEDAEIKQKILDMKDEIENNKASRSKDNVRRHKHNTRSFSNSSTSVYSSSTSLSDKPHSASIRRSSMRGEKNPLFMKEAKEEALHFGWRKDNDEDIVEDEKENLPSTNIDDVQLIIDDADDNKRKPQSFVETSLNGNTDTVEYSRNLSDTMDNRKQQHRNSKSKSPNETKTVNRTSTVDRPSASNPTANQQPSQESGQGSVQQGGPGLTKKHSFTRKSEQSPPQRQKAEPFEEEEGIEDIEEEKEDQSAPESNVRYPSGTPSITLADLKKHRSESRSRENSTIDTQVQNLFLSGLNSNSKKYSSSTLPREDNSDHHTDSNGHNNNMKSYPNHSEGIRRFTAPGHSPAIGGDEKQGCCVIL